MASRVVAIYWEGSMKPDSTLGRSMYLQPSTLRSARRVPRFQRWKAQQLYTSGVSPIFVTPSPRVSRLQKVEPSRLHLFLARVYLLARGQLLQLHLFLLPVFRLAKAPALSI